MAALGPKFKFGRSSVVSQLTSFVWWNCTATVMNDKWTWRFFNSNRNSITRINRTTYTRVYPTLLVQPDGSTIRIRYHIPQKIIKLPIDVTKLTNEDRRMHTDKHKLKQKIVIEEEIADDFNIDEYSHLWKKPPTNT